MRKLAEDVLEFGRIGDEGEVRVLRLDDGLAELQEVGGSDGEREVHELRERVEAKGCVKVLHYIMKGVCRMKGCEAQVCLGRRAY